MYKKYSEEIEQLKVKGTEGNNKTEYSDICFRNGVLHKEISGHSGSYYFCRCKKGYLGDNCEISKNIFQEV